MRSDTARVVCLGIVTLDRVWEVPRIPARPVKVTATACRETGGGIAATAAVAVAALGGAAACASAPPRAPGARQGRSSRASCGYRACCG